MASLGLDLGDDDMLNDGNDGSAPLAECVDGTAPLLPSASAGTSGEGGAADASEAVAANGLDERLRTTVPMFQAAARVSVDMLKNGLVHYGGVRFCDASLRKKPPNDHQLKAQYIRKEVLLAAWRQFLDTPAAEGGFSPGNAAGSIEDDTGGGAAAASTGTANTRAAGADEPEAESYMDSVLFATAKMYLRQWAAQIVPAVRRRSALAGRQIADEQGEDDDNARVQGKVRELCAVMTSATAFLATELLFHCSPALIVSCLSDDHFGVLRGEGVAAATPDCAHTCARGGLACENCECGTTLADQALREARLSVLELRYRTHGFHGA